MFPYLAFVSERNYERRVGERSKKRLRRWMTIVNGRMLDRALFNRTEFPYDKRLRPNQRITLSQTVRYSKF